MFAYDGTGLAENAIQQAARQLGPGRCGLVVCGWQPADVGFTPTDEDPSTRIKLLRSGGRRRGPLPTGRRWRRRLGSVRRASRLRLLRRGGASCVRQTNTVRASSCSDRTAAAGHWVTFRGVSRPRLSRIRTFRSWCFLRGATTDWLRPGPIRPQRFLSSWTETKTTEPYAGDPPRVCIAAQRVLRHVGPGDRGC